MIERSFVDQCGYWIILAPGYHDRLNPGSHFICADTESEARAALSDVELCDCRKCWPLERAG